MSDSLDFTIAHCRIDGAPVEGDDTFLRVRVQQLSAALIVAEGELRATARGLASARSTPRRRMRLLERLFGDANHDVELRSTADRICDTLAIYGPTCDTLPKPTEERG